MSDRFFNTPTRKGFHFPGRLLEGAGVLAEVIAQAPTPAIIVLDEALRERDLPIARDAVRIVVSREPTLDDARAAVERAAGENAASIIALGGGSTIDTAKAIATHLRYGRFDMRDAPREGRAPLLIAASSLPGAGSETSRFFILSDPATGRKISHRSFSAVPDITVLDPELVHGVSAHRLLSGAFDAFMHLWETFVCRSERAPSIDALALHYIPDLMDAADVLSRNVRPDATILTRLLYASAFGGVAISNVRTGLVHTLGESLAAQIAMPHPLTLLVFFSAGLNSYRDAIGDRLSLLLPILDARLPNAAPWSLSRIITHWHDAMVATGLYDRVRQSLSRGVDIDKLLIAAARDTVLAKENPAPLTHVQLTAIMRSALSGFSAPVLSSPAFTRL